MEQTIGERIEEANDQRLSAEKAHDLANLIITKFEEYDLSKLEPKDYEKALAEIESLKRWVDGGETTKDKFMAVLKNCSIFGASAIIGSIIVPEGSTVLVPFLLGLGVSGAINIGASQDKRSQFSELKRKNEERLEK